MIRGRLWTPCVVVLTSLVASCASTPSAAPNPVFFPGAPEQPRIQFLAAFSSSRDFESGVSLWGSLLGEGEESDRIIIKPHGIGFDGDGLYVCDTVQRAVIRLDFERERFEFFGDGVGFNVPVNCAVDPVTGNVYVADTGRMEVVVLSPDGRELGTISAPEESRFTDVFVDDEAIWVADSKGSRIRVFDRMTREEVRSFPDAEPGQPGAVGMPSYLWVTPERVYVTDVGGFRVAVYDRNGSYIGSIGSHGDGLGQFSRPKGVAADRSGNVYVVDAAFENVQIFNPEGELLMFFGGTLETPGGMAIPADVVIDYESAKYFQSLAAPGFRIDYVIYVTNGYGLSRVNVYGFLAPTAQDATGSE